MVWLAGGDLFSNLGSIMLGLSELLAVLGAGFGFVLRSRRNARREHSRAEAAAAVAASETKRVLEARLEAQHAAAIEQYKRQIQEMTLQQVAEREQYKQHVIDLTKDRQALLDRLLANTKEKKEA